MRHIATLLVVLFSLTGLAGCASTVQVDSLADPDFDFSSYHTFFWVQPKDGADVSNIGLQEPRVNRSVAYAIEANLESRGFERTTDGNPDFRINYILTIDPVTYVTEINRYYGYGADCTDAYIWPNNVQVSEEGTLIIDIIDNHTKEMVWRGIGSGQIDRTKPEDTQVKNVTAAVDKILKKFPPK